MPYSITDLEALLTEVDEAKERVFKAQDAADCLASGELSRGFRRSLSKIRGELEAMDRVLRSAIGEY
jgi:hypothetical protein